MPQLTTKDVLEVSRTGQSLEFNGYELTVDHLITNTSGADWDGCYLQLKGPAAHRITADLNQLQPWGAPKRIKAVAGRPRRALPRSKTPVIVDAEVVA